MNPLQEKIKLARAAGYSDAEIQSYLGAKTRPAITTVPTKSYAKPKKPGWTAGISEGSSLSGALAGAAIGSVVPGVGTAIGGIIGAGVGAFGGRIAENKVRDDRIGLGDAAKEGAISTVLAGPLKLGKYGWAASKGVKAGGGLTKTVANRGLSTVLNKAANEATEFSLTGGAKRFAGKKLLDTNDNLAQRALKINDSTFATDFANRTGEEIGQFANRFKLVGKSAKEINEGIYKPAQNIYSEGVRAVGEVPKDRVLTTVRAEVDDLLKSPLPEDRAFGKDIMKQADTLLKQYGPNIPAQQLNNLKTAAYKKVNTKLMDQAGIRSNNVYETLSRAFRRSISDAADEKGVAINPEVLKAAGLNFKSTKLGDLGEELFELKELTRKIDVKSRVGKGSQVFGFNKLTGAGAGGAVGGPAGIVAGAATSAALNSAAGARALSKGAEKLGTRLATSRAPGVIRTGIRRGLQGAGGGLIGALTQSPNSIDTTSIPTTTSTASTIPSNMSSLSAISGNMSRVPGLYDSPSGNLDSWDPNDPTAMYAPNDPRSQNPYPRENLMADIQRDPANRDEYIKYYQQMQEIYAPPEVVTPKPLNQGQQERADLIKALGLAEDTVAGGSINYGPIGSRIESFKGRFNMADPETLTYKNVVSGLRAAITKARAGASLTDGERALLSQYTPNETDSEQVVRSKLAALRQLYGYDVPTGGGYELQDVLSQYAR